MSFVTTAFVLAFFCLVLAAVALWASRQQDKGVAQTFLAVISLSYGFLALFAVLVAVGFSIELTNQAPCENLVNTTTADTQNVTPNGTTAEIITYYTYVDSCADRTVPASIERLYQAYSYLLLTVILLSSFALMFVAIRSVIFKW